MKTVSPNRLRLIITYVLYAISMSVLALFFYQNTVRSTLTELKKAGEVRLSEAVGVLRLQIDEYRALANVIADDPQMKQALLIGDYAQADTALEDFEATYGPWRIDLVGPQGQLLSSSAAADPTVNYPRPLLRAALNNRLGFGLAQEDGQRIVRLSRGVLVQDARPSGVVVVSISLSALEFEWPVSPETIVFFDAEEVAFSSNRPNLLLLSRGEDPEETPFDLTKTGEIGTLQLWRFAPPDSAAIEVIKSEKFVPHLNLTGVIFLDTAGARAIAQQRTILFLAGAVVLGLIGTVALQQRRRRVLEEQYSAELEARVEARTAELRGAQGALVEASKLAALGRLSAGVSHELNQPLAAILNFAENGQTFIARGKPETAAQNLTLISDQVRRITRIIGNLRAFARQETAPTGPVDFAAAVQEAMSLAKKDITAAGVKLRQNIPQDEVPVLAGQVRLEQVVLNLITNALDAMADSNEKTLDVDLSIQNDSAVLKVTDTGGGIADPTAVFEPFYTTKELGSSKGLGMGLALSHGIIARFGGQLSCRNLEQGAEFCVSLPLQTEAPTDA
ncbi:MAG: ATP-binding protein [Pseudomonadota bacterium]